MVGLMVCEQRTIPAPTLAEPGRVLVKPGEDVSEGKLILDLAADPLARVVGRVYAMFNGDAAEAEGLERIIAGYETDEARATIEQAAHVLALGAILAERGRQITEEGHTFGDDDAEEGGLLEAGAAAWLLEAGDAAWLLEADGDGDGADLWPWPEGWKPADKSTRRRLEIGVALALAALEREIRRDLRSEPDAPETTRWLAGANARMDAATEGEE